MRKIAACVFLFFAWKSFIHEQSAAAKPITRATDVSINFVGLPDRITSLALSSDGGFLAVVEDERNCSIYDLKKRKMTLKLRTRQATTWVIFTPDNQKLISNTGEFWNIINGRKITTLNWHRDIDAENNSVIHNSRTKNGLNLNTQRHLTEVVSASFSVNGSRIIAISVDDNLEVWSIQSRKRLLRVANVSMASISPDGKLLATRENDRICIRDAASGKIIASRVEAKLSMPTSWVQQSTMTWMDTDANLHSFTVPGLKTVRTVKTSAFDLFSIPGDLIDFSADAKRIVVGKSNNWRHHGKWAVAVFDVVKGRKIAEYYISSLNAVELSADGKLLAFFGVDFKRSTKPGFHGCIEIRRIK